MGLLSFTLDVFAKDDDGKGNPIVKGSVELHVPADSKIRPRTVLADYINCRYRDGVITLSADVCMMDLTLSITDEFTGETSRFYLMDMSQPVPVTLASGSYYIVCETSGVRYEGVLLIP